MAKVKKPVIIIPCVNGLLDKREFERLETKISYAYWHRPQNEIPDTVDTLCITVPEPVLAIDYQNLCHCANYSKLDGENLLRQFGIDDNNAGKLAGRAVIAYFLDGRVSALEPIRQKSKRKGRGDYGR